MKKRILAMLLTLCMVLSLLPVAAFAAPGPNDVASISETGYATLDEAFTAAKAGDTITLLANVNENVTVDKNVTIDGAGKNYTGTMTVNTSLNVTVQNVNFVKGCIAEEKGTHGTLTVKNCDFNGEDKSIGYAITMRGGDKVVIENSTATNYSYGMLYVPSSVAAISVKDVTVENVTAAFNISYSGNGTFENVTLKGVTYGLHVQNYGARTFTLEKCNFSCEYPIYVQVKGTATVTFAFEGDNDFGNKGTALNGYVILKLAQGATLTAPEGTTVTTDVAGYHVEYIEGIYQLVENDKVAQIDETKYETLQAAIDAANDGDTIKVLKDINITDAEVGTLDNAFDTYFKVEGKTVTIDLNGKKISGTYPQRENKMLVGVFSTDNNGHLTLTGNGTVDVTATGTVYSLIANYEDGCSITIENGTYKLDKASDSLLYTGGNEGIIVEDGIFTLGDVGTGQNGKPWIFNVLGAGDNHVIVTGGTFNANIQRQHWANEVLVPKTHYVEKNADGTWTVNDGAVLSVNEGILTGPYYVEEWEIGYPSFEAFFAAANVSTEDTIDLEDPIILLADVEITTPIDVSKSSFNPNGKTITLSENGSLTVSKDTVVTPVAITGYQIVETSNPNDTTTYSVEKNQYTVTFDANGGRAVDSQTVKHGDTATQPTTDKSGYRLQGWYLDGEKYDFSTPVTDDITLTAKWKKKAAKPVEPQPPVHDCPSEKFIDVDQSLWYHEGIDYAIVNNLMNGVADNLFAPNGTTNRAMIVTILYRLEGSPAAEAPTFSDVADDQWYTDAVGWAAANGIVTGYDEDTFGPLNPITREQMAAILYRYADSKGYDVSADQDTNLLSFTDAETVSQYAIPAIQWAVGEGLINGVEGNALAPQGTASRAQVATILMRFCENVVK